MAESDSKYELISRKEAKAKGRKFYYTGRNCKRGHVCLRLVSSEMCWQCSLEGRRRWHRDNREKDLRASRRRYYANKAYHLNYAKEYYVKNTELLKAKSKKYRDNHPGWASKNGQKNYQKNREYYQKKNKEWMRNNPEARRAIKQNRRAREQNAEGKYTANDVLELLERQKGKCVYCSASLAKKYHVDHILPLARGGSNWPSNLQLLCQKCNLHKHARDPIEHAQSLGLLL